MATPDTTSADSAASKINSPATKVVAGVLALALGGLGIAAWKMKGNAPEMAAKDDQSEEAKAKEAQRKAADEAAAAALAGTPSKATLIVAPKEDPALDAPGAGQTTGPKPDIAEDPSLK